MKTYWMAFAEATTGKNLGVCVVEVTAEQAAEAVALVKRINPKGKCEHGEEWTVAAVGQSLRLKCNPGGGMQLTEVLDPSVLPVGLPRNTLILPEELQQNGWV
jgi:hypothetical protein